jgi:hypothetical protein
VSVQIDGGGTVVAVPGNMIQLSVRGLLSNEDPYRDRAPVTKPSGNAQTTTLCPIGDLFSGRRKFKPVVTLGPQFGVAAQRLRGSVDLLNKHNSRPSGVVWMPSKRASDHEDARKRRASATMARTPSGD